MTLRYLKSRKLLVIQAAIAVVLSLAAICFLTFGDGRFFFSQNQVKPVSQTTVLVKMQL